MTFQGFQFAAILTAVAAAQSILCGPLGERLLGGCPMHGEMIREAAIGAVVVIATAATTKG